MPKQARIGDTVKIDCPHGPQTGIITTGSSYDFVDSRSTARLGDTVICCYCGEKGQIVSGSAYTFVDSKKSARVGDKTVGICNYGCKLCKHSRTGTIQTGSSFTYTG